MANKKLLIIMIITLLVLSGCGVDENETRLKDLEGNYRSLKVADSDILKKIDDLKASLNGYTPVDMANVLDSRIKTLETKPESDQASLIANQQTQINDLKSEIEALKVEINNLKVVAQENPKQINIGEKLSVLVTKDTDKIGELSSTSESSVDFTVKLINKTSSKLDNIVIEGYIECSRNINLADGYPVLKDSTNNSLIFDYDFDDDERIDFTFSESTGSPTVYLNPNETFTFHPQLVLRGDDDYDRYYKFTLEITEFTVGE